METIWDLLPWIASVAIWILMLLWAVCATTRIEKAGKVMKPQINKEWEQ